MAAFWLFKVLAICAFLSRCFVSTQVAYIRHLSELRIKELHTLAVRLNQSIDREKSACDSYYDYVCSRNRPLFSILGHLPDMNELMQLMTDLENDHEHFAAKQKLIDFFISCNTRKTLEDCYREAFEYFKPLFGFIITKKYIDASSHEHENFLDAFQRFLTKANSTEGFGRHPLHAKLTVYSKKFRTPYIYFRAGDLNREYAALRIYLESYEHNVRNLELHRRRNSTYELGVQRTMLDWSLYLFQSRNKPMSYYFSTLNVHLWMMLYNSTERTREPRYFEERGRCLNLPQFVNVLEEARILAIVYLKSFRSAYEDYSSWLMAPAVNKEISDHEDAILSKNDLNNKKLFFTFYAQNFCDFGKEVAENVFYLGLQKRRDFFETYSCGYQSDLNSECV